jgi:hypothetical protein
MFYTQESIRKIALRIERAYCRRYPQWISAGMTPGVWDSAATRLLVASQDKLGLPIDPELFVAVQEPTRVTPDPWSELTQHRSVVRYRKALKRIILRLRQELKAEITRGECRILRGLDLDQVLETEGSRLSPLSRYILSHRAGRLDLSIKHHSAALNQHRSCPLYRIAARSLLPDHAYPAMELPADSTMIGQEFISFSRN